MQYASITVWQSEDYEITVKLGGFSTHEEAAYFGNTRAKKLQYINSDPCGLVLIDDESNEHVLSDFQVCVEQIKEEFRGRVHTYYPQHFERVDIKIAQFCDIPDLTRGFGSLAFGVEEIASTVITQIGVEP